MTHGDDPVCDEGRSTSDGKANSKISPTTLHFCPAAGCPLGLPSITTATVSPTTINIDSSGVLQSTFTVTATTANLDIAATVTAIVQTQIVGASVGPHLGPGCLGAAVLYSR